MSPFLTYAEVIPSKPSKILCQHLLFDYLQHLTATEILFDQNNQPSKRKKQGEVEVKELSKAAITKLKQEKNLYVGLNDV